MLIAASGRIVDGSGDLELVHSLENRLGTAGLRVREVNTASLKMGWQTALPENYLCSACSPMQAGVPAGIYGLEIGALTSHSRNSPIMGGSRPTAPAYGRTRCGTPFLRPLSATRGAISGKHKCICLYRSKVDKSPRHPCTHDCRQRRAGSGRCHCRRSSGTSGGTPR